MSSYYKKLPLEPSDADPVIAFSRFMSLLSISLVLVAMFKAPSIVSNLVSIEICGFPSSILISVLMASTSVLRLVSLVATETWVASVENYRGEIFLGWNFKEIRFYVVLCMYRHGQPNWEITKWKFQDFSASQILREINFGYFEAPKTAILTICAALNFEFLGNSDIWSVNFF